MQTSPTLLDDPAFLVVNRIKACVFDRSGEGFCGSGPDDSTFIAPITLETSGPITSVALAESSSAVWSAATDPPRVERHSPNGANLATYPVTGRVVELQASSLYFAGRVQHGALEGVVMGSTGAPSGTLAAFYTTSDSWIQLDQHEVGTAKLLVCLSPCRSRPRHGPFVLNPGVWLDSDSARPTGLMVELRLGSGSSSSQAPVLIRELAGIEGSNVPLPRRLAFRNGPRPRLVTVAQSNRELVLREWYDRATYDSLPW